MAIGVHIRSLRCASLVNVGLALCAVACSVSKANDEAAFGTDAGASSDNSGGAGSGNGGASTTDPSAGEAGSGSGSAGTAGAPAAGGGSAKGGSAGRTGLGGAAGSSGGASDAGANGAAATGGGASGAAATGGGAGSSTSGGASGGTAGVGAMSGKADPNRGLILYYDFDETSGTVVHDQLSPANDGIVRGNATWTGLGQIRGALKLAGGQGDTLDPQYVEIPQGVLRSLQQTTVSAWIHWEGGWAWQRVFDFGSDPDHCFFYTPDSGGAGQAVVRTMPGSNNVNLFITERPPLGKWMHLAVTWSSAGFAVYMDGDVKASAPAGASVPAPSVTPSSLGISPRNFIGRSQSDADAYLEGSIDEFKIFDRVLTQAEIVALRDFRP